MTEARAGRLVGGSVLIAALLLVVGWSRLPSRSPAAGAAAPRVTPVDPREEELPRVLPGPAPPPEPIPTDSAMGAARALADVLGEGVIRCDLGQDPTELHAHGTLHHVQTEGTLLTAVVHDGEGRATLHRSAGPLPERERHAELPASLNPIERMQRMQSEVDATRRWMDAMEAWAEAFRTPILVVDWWDAGPGQLGSCAVSVPEPVVVRGRIERSNGEPMFGAVMSGGRRMARSDRSGAFEIEATLGMDCHLQVSGGDEHGELWFTPTTHRVDGLVVRLQPDPPEPADQGRWRFELHEEWLADAEQELEDLGGALATDLPPDVRARVESWRKDAAEQVERLRPE